MEDITPIRLAKWVFEFEKPDNDYVALYHSLEIDAIFLEKKFKWIIELLKMGTTLSLIVDNKDAQEEALIRDIMPNADPWVGCKHRQRR